MVGICEEKVIEVATDLLRRTHGGIKVNLSLLRIRREYARQHVSLDLCGNIELGTDSLLLGSDCGDLVDIILGLCGQVLKCPGKDLDLIICEIRVLDLEIEG